MKDLIIIGAHCPDKEREELLHSLINSLSEVKDHFDIMVSTHINPPSYIVDKVDYVFYDKNNDLIVNDLKYLNQPWFKPNNESIIFTTFLSGYSTYLAVYRLLIGSLGLGKSLGYKKAHYIEYDTYIPNFEELLDNSKLLDSYSSIQYKYQNNKSMPWGIGNMVSFNLKETDNLFLEYNKEKLLSFIEEKGKTNERITDLILSRNNKLDKDVQILLDQGFKLNQSSECEKDELDIWAVPYYNPKNGNIEFICWNQKSKEPINVNVIINSERSLSFKNVIFNHYHTRNLGPISEINDILILINNKVKTYIDFSILNKEEFKTTNLIQHD